MARLLRVAIFMACVFSAGSAFATVVPGGTCPASAPVTGKNCYFIAASGSDTNNGTSETTPWLHAPGMQKCASNCAAVLSYTSGGIRGSAAGLGFIFRGGDTWHFGNSGLSPYTGGTYGRAVPLLARLKVRRLAAHTWEWIRRGITPPIVPRGAARS